MNAHPHPLSPLRRFAVAFSALALASAALWLPPPDDAQAQAAAAVQVDTAADRRPIDPRIYGVNWADAAQLAALNVPVHRWGGNSTTRHNWKTNGDNRGSDWYFQSIPGSGAPGAAFDDFAQEAKSNGAEPMVTIPLIGWVGKSGPNGSKLASFLASKYGPQQDCDWSWFPDACNGVRTDGSYVSSNDPNDANVAVDAQYMKEWAQHLVSRWGLAAGGGVKYYIYDNEPSLWHHTHRDVHPAGQTMTELRDRMIAYGTALKQADPGAVFVGPEEWGWTGYFYSGYDQKYNGETGCWSCSPDKTANGGMEHVPWLLQQMRQHEQSSGNKLLHVFTLHYYPQGGEFWGGTSSSEQALRNRSTRSLWDPNYTDESWIGDKVRLIPRMREWVNTYYPGLETGITEYNWGAHDHINGATAQADVLGIFGRQGLNIGTLWTTPATSSPTFKAIQMYRNYDGAKSTFGDVSVKATGPNPDTLAVFAAERTSDGALTIMAINKVTTSNLVSISLANFAAGSAAQVWQLTPSNAIQRKTDVAVSGGTINTTLLAQSITLFVVPGTGSALPSLSVSDVTVTEGHSGTTNATFTVTLSAAATSTVTVDYATANGTATAGSDYTATTGTLTFTPGQTTKTVPVPVAGDTTLENTETFTLTLTNPSGTTLSKSQGNGTITNDDFPALSIDDVTVTEGNSGTTNATFTVTLSAAATFTVTVNFATANGAATAPGDYAAQTGNLSFSAGQTSKTITVAVTGDSAVESNETFIVTLTNPSGATLSKSQGTGAITNDDTAPPPTGAEPVVWTSLVGVTANGNSLTKTAANGWTNGGAVSTQQIASGDGYVEVTASEANTYRFFGLSKGSSDQTYQDIDFALYQDVGTIRIYEAGSLKGAFGAYVSGDKLRVAVVGGVVKYSKNGVVFYTSTKTPEYPLLVDTALYSQSATLNAAIISGATSPSPSAEPAVWTSLVGVTANGNSLTKTAANGWTNGGAVSTQQIASGDGYVEVTASEANTYRFFGLSKGSSDQTYQDIDFALYQDVGTIRVYEAGSLKGAFGAYVSGDKLRVAVVGGVVKYSKNGVVFYTSAKVPAYPLLVDTALYSQGATLLSAVIAGATPAPSGSEPVVWTSLVGVTATGSSLTKTATNGWTNGGAISTRQITSGDGYVELTASETNTYRMFGLSNGNSDQTYQDIDFAFYQDVGTIRIYESGSLKGAFGGYAPGDKLRVAIVGGVVKYSRNGVVFYTSTKAPAYPLLIDTALYSSGATLNFAFIGGSQ